MAIPIEALQAYNAVRQCPDKRSICHAPSYSMYFGRGGYVSACCYSRTNDPLGRYPDQTISEIWFGKGAQDMRRRMLGDTLPAGCDICAEQLIARNFSGLLAKGFDSLARK